MTHATLRLATIVALGSTLLGPACSFAANCSKGQNPKGTLDFNGETYAYQAKCKGDWNVILVLSLNGGDFTASVQATEEITNRQCNSEMHTPGGGVTDFKQQKGSCDFDSDHAVKFQVKRK
jgi:hypothetical protein